MSKAPVQFSDLAYPVIIFDNCVQVGCEKYSYSEWKSFTEREIKRMDGSKALEFYPVLMDILKPIFDRLND
ncbi:MAG: hypothetical protein DRN81_03040 [Thermoproteota archaeon]|nr:MAG: hypothetical protein DRN81_03040 [Candidatus Korarchaeota archaeon]